MATQETKTLITHDSKGNLTGSESLGGKTAPTVAPKVKSFLETKEEKKALKPILSEKLKETMRVNLKANKIILDRQRYYDYPDSRLALQIEEFRIWALPESSVPDIAAPDENFRYDLLEPIVGDAGQLKAFRRLGYEHYLGQRFPVFFSNIERMQTTVDRMDRTNRMNIISGAVASVADASIPGATFVADSSIVGGFALRRDEHASVPGVLYFLKDTYPYESVRADLDKATRFNKDNLEGSPYVRKLLEVPSGDITRLAWGYFANEETK